MISVSFLENYGTKKDELQYRFRFQYRFAFVEECGGDEGGVSREFYSSKTMSGQLCFKFFPLIHYFHKSNLKNVYLVNFIVINQVAVAAVTNGL